MDGPTFASNEPRTLGEHNARRRMMGLPPITPSTKGATIADSPEDGSGTVATDAPPFSPEAQLHHRMKGMGRLEHAELCAHGDHSFCIEAKRSCPYCADTTSPTGKCVCPPDKVAYALASADEVGGDAK